MSKSVRREGRVVEEIGRESWVDSTCVEVIKRMLKRMEREALGRQFILVGMVVWSASFAPGTTSEFNPRDYWKDVSMGLQCRVDKSGSFKDSKKSTPVNENKEFDPAPWNVSLSGEPRPASGI